MKALVLKAPGEAAVEAVPDIVRNPDQVLLQVRSVGLCGTDLNSFRGKNPLITYPRILGHEIAATIVEGTSNADPVQKASVAVMPYSSCGKCPACRQSRPNTCQFNQTMGVQRDGALTEYIQVSPDKLFPADLPVPELSLVEPLSVGFHAVQRGRITARDTVAVIGSGGVGMGAIAGAAFRGARVIAIDLDSGKLEIARKTGAAHLINTSSDPLPESLSDLTNGSGPDVIIEAVGRPDTFRAAVEHVAFAGRVVYIGYAKEPVAYETRLFVQKELDILGSRNALPENFLQVIRMLEQKRFPVREYITATVTLAEAPQMLGRWS
ncbi:MAG: zinc-binding alcohol dehydrogenase family protein, partial [Silvibacterium sp.]|nr:zinc-binding alcohol dehydrogenase family protein [Silvibacterium sp.]